MLCGYYSYIKISIKLSSDHAWLRQFLGRSLHRLLSALLVMMVMMKMMMMMMQGGAP
jgi:hypothetical protein